MYHQRDTRKYKNALEKLSGKVLTHQYDVLSRMRMSWVSARSIHPKTNIEKQEAFKKTLM